MEKLKLLKDININISKKITKDQAINFKLLPFKEDKEKVYAFAYDKPDKKHLEVLSFIFKKKVDICCLQEDMYKEILGEILEVKIEGLEEEIFKDAILKKASDIHFEPQKEGLEIKYRINGALTLQRKLSLEEYLQVASRLKINSGMDITEKRRPQDGKMLMTAKGVAYNCRLSSVPVVYGEKIVLRILYSNNILKPIKDLTFTKEQFGVINRIQKMKSGLVLINGPTGSGKSTTLYTFLNEIKKEDINITTLEDPIEVTMEGINQVNLNPKIGLDFPEGLRALLRQDPNLIMVGEIRDELTAQMAVRASITGHKVYSTIHTKSPREVFLRLEEMGVKPYLIRDALVGLISQRLVKTLCSCKEEVKTLSYKGKVIKLYKKVGCPSCYSSGYKGRRLVASVYFIDKATREKLQEIHTNEELLSNTQMLEELQKLLEFGEIDYYDYLDIVEGEELLLGEVMKI